MKNLLAAALLLTSSAAFGAYTVTITQSVAGITNVTGSGSLDLGTMTVDASHGGGLASVIDPTQPAISVGTGTSVSDQYTASTGFTVTPYGSGGVRTPMSASGEHVSASLVGGVLTIYVPPGYVAGSPLGTSTAEYDFTLADLGLTPGTTVWTLPSSDTFTIVVEPPPVTGGSTVAVPTLTPGWIGGMAALLAGLGACSLRRRRR